MGPSTYQQTERMKWPAERSRLRCEAGEGNAKSRFQTSWIEGGWFRWKKVGGRWDGLFEGKVEVEGRKWYQRNTRLEKREYRGRGVDGDENMKLWDMGLWKEYGVKRERKRKVDDGKKRRGSRLCP